jgi:hypothetical protein
MSAVIVRSHRVYAFGAPAGRIDRDAAGWHHTFDAARQPLGRWSTERRALHAIEQDMLLELYGTHQRAANE